MTQNRWMRARIGLALVVAAFAFATGGCGTSASLNNVWKDPSYTAGGVSNILVVNLAADAGIRRSTEDVMVSELAKRNLRAVPSYRAFPDSIPNPQVVREVVLAEKYDGVLVSRLVGKEKNEYYVPPTATTVGTYGYPGNWYGYYGSVYQTYYSPGYYGTEDVYSLDTSLWSTQGEKGKLIWSGTSLLTDPRSATEVAQKVSSMVIPQMIKDGVLK